MRQGIAVGMANHFACRCRIAREVSLARRGAPGSFGIPMPCLNKQLGILAITDRAPTCLENLLDLVRPEKSIRRIRGNAIDSAAQCAKWAERVCNVARSCIDTDGLRGGAGGRQYRDQE